MIAVLAVDGGQSGIRLRHSGGSRVVEAGGVVRSGDTVAAVARAVGEAWRSATFPAVDRVVLGLTTAPVDAGEADRLCALIAAETLASEVWLSDDTVTAHCGALSGAAGVALVVGTGVACLAAPANGTPRVFDGNGYLLGDEGGAFWIGRRALREVLRARDRGTTTALTMRAESRFGRLDHLSVRLHESASPVNAIAQFARDVLEFAEQDQAAAAVIDEAARRLLATAVAAADYQGEPNVPLALGGRMLEPNTPLRGRLDLLLADEAVAPRSSDAAPIDGALLLGTSDFASRYPGLIHFWSERATS